MWVKCINIKCIAQSARASSISVRKYAQNNAVIVIDSHYLICSYTPGWMLIAEHLLVSLITFPPAIGQLAGRLYPPATSQQTVAVD